MKLYEFTVQVRDGDNEYVLRQFVAASTDALARRDAYDWARAFVMNYGATVRFVVCRVADFVAGDVQVIMKKHAHLARVVGMISDVESADDQVLVKVYRIRGGD